MIDSEGNELKVGDLIICKSNTDTQKIFICKIVNFRTNYDDDSVAVSISLKGDYYGTWSGKFIKKIESIDDPEITIFLCKIKRQ